MQETAEKSNENLALSHEISPFVAENAANLPFFARDLIQMLGFDKALEVIKALGGASWRIPATDKTGAERAAICARIGEPLFSLLQKRYAGETLYVPKCHKALLAARNQSICTALKQSAGSVRELVARFNLSDRRIRQIAGTHYTSAPPDRDLLSALA